MVCRRDQFTLDLMEKVPQGAGSGTIWGHRRPRGHQRSRHRRRLRPAGALSIPPNLYELIQGATLIPIDLRELFPGQVWM